LVADGWLIERTTWDDKRLRPAGYDLVIAPDDLQVPNREDPDNPTIYRQGEPIPGGRFTLRPGEFAFVTTRERLALPWTVSGNVGVRNRFARQGLLILTGLLIDPGYGLTPQGRSWGKDPQRLHFGIANVGRDEISIVAEVDAIASIQFIKVSGEVKLGEGYVPATSDPIARGFGLFDLLERRVQDLDADLGRTKASVSNVVVFGLYLILATLFGVAIATIFGVLGAESVLRNLSKGFSLIREHPWPTIALVLVSVSAAVILASVVLWPITRLLVGRKRSRK
jgi:deoxycytidine triphosphate deaminase